MALMRWIILATALMTIAATVQAQPASGSTTPKAASATSADQIAWLRYIAAEVGRIHLEILEDRRQVQQTAMQDTERELESIHARQSELQEEQRSQVQQASDIEAQLTQAGLGKAEREELEAQRAELLSLSPARFGTAQNALGEREAHVRERLADQERRLRAIEQQLGELAPGRQ